MTAAAWHTAATLAAPGLRIMLRRRVAHGKEIAGRLAERRGLDASPRPAGRLVWLHGASVGEMLSALPVAAALGGQAQVLFTTGTVTSARLLAQRVAEQGLGHLMHRFVPLDVPAWAARFVAHWRPDAAVFIESELWPNLLAACQARAVPMMLLNARMSERSLAGWRRAPGFAREVVGAFDLVQAQSAADADRLRALGARSVDHPGNLKFAAPPLPADAAELARLTALIGDRPVWLAASTHRGEEAQVAAAHALLAPQLPGLLTIVAPRHPERGAAVAEELGGAPRRSFGAGPSAHAFWVADTLGELGLLYRLAPLAFIGRSLMGGGGQNPLEAARLGCVVCAGPLTANFEEAYGALDRLGALGRVAGAGQLADWVGGMLADHARRAAAAAAGRRAADSYGGLVQHSVEAILKLAR